jgi:hypothetical protein
VKDLLLNVGSGGGAAAAAPAAGGAAASGAAAEEAKEEEKEEGTCTGDAHFGYCASRWIANDHCREGRVRRGHGFRPLRLSEHLSCLYSLFACLNSERISIAAFGLGWRLVVEAS